MSSDKGRPPPKVSALELHPEYAEAMGMISAEIGILEMFLGDLLAAILGVKRHVGQTVYLTPQSYSGRLQILENVIEILLLPTAEGTRHLHGILKRAKARIQYRNDAMHSVWGLDKSDRSVVTRRAVPLLKPAVPVKIEELKGEIEKLRDLIQDVEEEIPNVTRQRIEFAAWQEKQRKQDRATRKPKRGLAARKSRAPRRRPQRKS